MENDLNGLDLARCALKELMAAAPEDREAWGLQLHSCLARIAVEQSELLKRCARCELMARRFPD